MKLYEALDMNGQEIRNCPNAGEVVVQETEPTDLSVKWWVVPEKKQEEPVYDEEGNLTGDTYTAIIPASLLYRDSDGTFKSLASIAGAPGRDGFSPTVTVKDLLDDDGNSIGVTITAVDRNTTTSENILNGAEGKKGTDGVSIVSVVETGTSGNNKIFTITYSDNSTSEYSIPMATPVTKTSELTNDSGFLTETANNLLNYYIKSEVYTKDEVEGLLHQISAGLKTEIVGTLPDPVNDGVDTSTIYLVRIESTDIYRQYMWISGGWANLGTTQIDMSNLYSKTEIDAKLSTYVTTVALVALMTPYAKNDDLHKVAKTGKYTDLEGLPTIPSVDGLASTAYVDNSVSALKTDLETQIPDVSGFRKKTDKVAFEDISGHPTLPVVEEQLTNTTNPVQGAAILDKFKEMQAVIDTLRNQIKSIPVSGISSTDGADLSFDDPLISSFVTDFTKNFKISARFSIPKLGNRYVLCGDYGKGTCTLNIEPYADGHMRFYFNSAPDLKGLGETELEADTIYDFEFIWTASTRTCVGKLNGEEILNRAISARSLYGVEPLVIGADYRTRNETTSSFDAIKIYKFDAKFT